MLALDSSLSLMGEPREKENLVPLRASRQFEGFAQTFMSLHLGVNTVFLVFDIKLTLGFQGKVV